MMMGSGFEFLCRGLQSGSVDLAELLAKLREQCEEMLVVGRGGNVARCVGSCSVVLNHGGVMGKGHGRGFRWEGVCGVGWGGGG